MLIDSGAEAGVQFEVCDCVLIYTFIYMKRGVYCIMYIKQAIHSTDVLHLHFV